LRDNILYTLLPTPRALLTLMVARMQVWNVLHAARWKYRTQKSSSGHNRTTLSGYIFATTDVSTIGKKLVKHNISSTCIHIMVNFGPTGFASWLLYCSDVAHRRPTKLRTMFSRLLGWYYVYIFGDSCPLMEICQMLIYCVQVLRSPILHGSVTARHSSSGREPNFVAWYKEWNYEISHRAPPIFGWAAITLGIGPHSRVCSQF